MKISKQSRRTAKQLFRRCQINEVLDETRVRQLVHDVVSGKPRGYLPILAHLKRLVQLELDRRTAHIASAVPLPPPLQAAFQANLVRRYGVGLQFDLVQNPALIGGVRIQVGSDVYDGSIQSRLNALRESL